MFLELEELLRGHGHSVIPFAAQDPKNLSSDWSDIFPRGADFERPGPIDLLRYKYSFSSRKAIQEIIRTQRPDIAHLHIYYGKMTGSILQPLKSAGIPVVQTLHEYKLICPVYTLISNNNICEACGGKQFWRAISKKCNRNSVSRSLLSASESYISQRLGAISSVDHFMAVSEFVRLKMIQHGIPEEKISTVYNFIDLAAIPPSSTRGKYLLYAGRLERTKGVLSLLEAVEPLKDIEIKFVGTGSAQEEMDYLIESRGLDHVKMLGFVEGKELSELMANSLCLILPSEWYEPFGLVILEGFAHSRPVIASNIGGIPEVITDGEDGFLVDPGNAEALREKLQWMADHPETSLEMGRSGRKKVEDKYNPEDFYRNLMKIYKSVS